MANNTIVVSNNNNITTSSSSSSSNGCNLPSWYLPAAEQFQSSLLNFVGPVHILTCLPGQALLMAILLGRANSSRDTYAYQIFVAAGELAETVAITVYLYLFYLCSSLPNVGRMWYKQHQGLVWISAHASLALVEMTVNTSLYLALCMSIDRLLALVRPFAYKQLNHGKYRRLSVLVAVLLGVASGLYNCFLFKVIPIDGGFRMTTDLQFADGRLGNALNYLTAAVRVFGLGSLIVGNILIVHCYYNRRRQTAKILSRNSVFGAKEEQRKTREKTLVTLTICQSTFCAVKTLSAVAFYTAEYTMTEFHCYAHLLGPVLDVIFVSVNMLNSVAPFLAVPRFRIAVRTLLCSRSRQIASGQLDSDTARVSGPN